MCHRLETIPLYSSFSIQVHVVFDSNAGITGSNHTLDMVACPPFVCLCCPVYVKPRDVPILRTRSNRKYIERIHSSSIKFCSETCRRA
jgi:hypothetical protein